jgi:hypothetical protein
MDPVGHVRVTWNAIVAAIVRSSLWSRQSYPAVVHHAVPKHSVIDSLAGVAVAVAVVACFGVAVAAVVLDAVAKSSCCCHSTLRVSAAASALAAAVVASVCYYYYCHCAGVPAVLSFPATPIPAFLAVPKSPASRPLDRRHGPVKITLARDANFDSHIHAVAVASDPWKWDGGVDANWNAIDSAVAAAVVAAHSDFDLVEVPPNCCDHWAIRARAAWETAPYRETKLPAQHVAAAEHVVAAAEQVGAVDAGRVLCSPNDCGVVAVVDAAVAVDAAEAVASDVGAVAADYC